MTMTTNQERKKDNRIGGKYFCQGQMFYSRGQILEISSFFFRDLPTVRSDKRARATASLQGTFRIEGGNLPGIWLTPRKLYIKKERSEKAISSVPQRAHPTPGGSSRGKTCRGGNATGMRAEPESQPLFRLSACWERWPVDPPRSELSKISAGQTSTTAIVAIRA